MLENLNSTRQKTTINPVMANRIMEIFQNFCNSDDGKILNSQVRYERYKPTTVSNERWIKILGADVNNLNHMRLTYGLTRIFLEKQKGKFSNDEVNILLLTSIIHDIAEAKIGDISYDQKTDSDENEESKIATNLFQTILFESTLNIDPNEIQKYYLIKHILYLVYLMQLKELDT
ncbi:MAG: HD domain-containing protein [Candidatus Gracilibacteria bacterium]|jgi:hypothetical protein|nr:HD domain-containing protein [Candidatus Gracilibacteria bacterium]